MRGAVVVVNYASSRLLEENLVRLGSPGRAPHVVVVDNFSSVDERTRVTALARRHGWELVAQENLGFGAGMNVGVERALRAGCTELLLLNPDVTVEPVVVDELLRHVRDEPDALLSPVLRHTDGSPAVTRGTLDVTRGLTRSRGEPDPAHEPWLSGACLALSTDLWRRADGLCEAYFMYWEDLELSWRCRRLGARLVVRSDLTAVHAVGGTQGHGKSPLYRYYNCRNRLLFARRNLPFGRAVRWLASTPRYAMRVALRDGRRPLLQRPLATVVPVVRGTVAGVRVLLAPDRVADGAP